VKNTKSIAISELVKLLHIKNGDNFVKEFISFFSTKRILSNVENKIGIKLIKIANSNNLVSNNIAKKLSKEIFEIDFEPDDAKKTTLNNYSRLNSTSVVKKLPYGKSYPKISVITPSYNQGQYIEETILSIINQNYPNIEFILIDGGSTDKTMDIVNKYSSKINYFVSEKDKGQSDALNKGFNLATGEILCWLNSDDQFAPGALEAVAMAFATHNVDLVIGVLEVYKNGIMTERHMTACSDGILPLSNLLDLDNGWNVGQFFYQPEVFFTKRIWNKAGGYIRTDCYYSMDYELWLRFAFNNAMLHVIGYPLAKFRIHDEQKTHEKSKFKAELVEVRNRFIVENKISNWTIKSDYEAKKLKILFINDNGFNYGAGIAHERIFNSFKISGSNVHQIILSDYIFNNNVFSSEKFHNDCFDLSPDLIIFGNTHGVLPDSIDYILKLTKSFPIIWVTHDFWIVTGKCPYVNSCNKYKTNCDSECPALHEYPIVKQDKISMMHISKKELFNSENFYILSNSDYSKRFILDSNCGVSKDRISVFNLGLDNNYYEVFDKSSARKIFGISPDRFVIAFSASSISDVRKGGLDLINILSELKEENLTLLIMGNIDYEFDFTELDVIKTGYLNDPLAVTAAMQSADIYVGLSKDETFGQVYIESAMAGTPSIGLNRSGVVNAISDGVTGKLITPEIKSIVSVLSDAIAGRGAFLEMKQWASVYARNEFSLEASYHSLFTALVELKIVEKLRIPFKISLAPISNFINSKYILNFNIGISNEEGPYPPTYTNKFRWLHGPISEIIFISMVDANFQFEFSFINPLFTLQDVIFTIDGFLIDSFSIKKNQESNFYIFKFNRRFSPGRHIFSFKTNNQLSSPTEVRRLSLILMDLNVKF
jgi:glycosyltransferase involved in cell wall biosynthesis